MSIINCAANLDGKSDLFRSVDPNQTAFSDRLESDLKHIKKGHTTCSSTLKHFINVEFQNFIFFVFFLFIDFLKFIYNF